MLASPGVREARSRGLAVKIGADAIRCFPETPHCCVAPKLELNDGSAVSLGRGALSLRTKGVPKLSCLRTEGG